MERMSSSLVDKAEQVGNSKKVPQTGGRLGWFDLVRRAGTEVGDDHVSAFAGNLTYHALLAIFPFAIFVLSVLFIGGREQLLVDAIDNLRSTGALSPGAANVIVDQVDAIAETNAGAIGVSLVVSILLALWAVSGAFRSVMEAMNVMYEVEETRGFVKRYGTSMVLSLIIAALFVVALGLVVAGPAIASTFGAVGEWAWLVLQWPVLIGLVLFGLALLYYYAPSVEQEFRFITPGAILGTVVWLVFSIAFSLYVNNFGNYNETYGTLAGVIVLLLYSYYSAFIFLFGAEVNQVIEDAAPDGKDEGEKTADGAPGSGSGSGTRLDSDWLPG
jgi:membrane protein